MIFSRRGDYGDCVAPILGILNVGLSEMPSKLVAVVFFSKASSINDVLADSHLGPRMIWMFPFLTRPLPKITRDVGIRRSKP